jgi:hypothetical protein
LSTVVRSNQLGCGLIKVISEDYCCGITSSQVPHTDDSTVPTADPRSNILHTTTQRYFLLPNYHEFLQFPIHSKFPNNKSFVIHSHCNPYLDHNVEMMGCCPVPFNSFPSQQSISFLLRTKFHCSPNRDAILMRCDQQPMSTKINNGINYQKNPLLLNKLRDVMATV